MDLVSQILFVVFILLQGVAGLDDSRMRCESLPRAQRVKRTTIWHCTATTKQESPGLSLGQCLQQMVCSWISTLTAKRCSERGLQPAQCQCHSTALLLRMKNGNITLDHGRSGTCKWRLRPPGQNTMLLLIRQRKLPDQATQDDDSCSYRMTIDGNRPARGVSCFAYFEHGPCNASYVFTNRTCDCNTPGSRVTIKLKPVGMAQESDVGESTWIEYRYINCGPQAEEPLKLENTPWLKYVIITCSIVAVLCCMLLAYFRCKRKNQKSAPESQIQRPPSELYNDTVVSPENGAFQSPPTLGAQAPQIPLSEDVSVAVHHTYVNVSVRTRIYEEIVDANRRNTYLKPIPVPKPHYDAWG